MKETALPTRAVSLMVLGLFVWAGGFLTLVAATVASWGFGWDESAASEAVWIANALQVLGILGLVTVWRRLIKPHILKVLADIEDGVLDEKWHSIANPEPNQPK